MHTHSSSPAAWQAASDLTPLYLLLAASWFAAALLFELGAFCSGALGLVCLVHAGLEATRQKAIDMLSCNGFAARWTTPRVRLPLLAVPAEWEGRAAA